MSRRRYRITGIVQGVGFRPFIHKLASECGLAGWVLNDSEGVLVEVEGAAAILDEFIERVGREQPPLASIDSVSEVETSDSDRAIDHQSFVILDSIQLEETRTLVPPDSFVCNDCVREMFDPDDRRYRYPFINCTNCGPRYSIIESMPYDRPKTTMRVFAMCPACDAEYHDIRSRRYHAQPNACPVCGPELDLRDAQGQPVAEPDILGFCRRELLAGKIFAIKSVGGFHLAVDARNDAALRALRTRKRRDSKPFALMVRDASVAEAIAQVSSHELGLLQSVQRPIVILAKRGGTLPNSIAPANPNYGVMLPSAPLHHLLLESPELDALVMTSGNVSGRPIVFTNEDALVELASIVDYFLLNDRDIHLRVDDSIVRQTLRPDGSPATAFIRRARGYAPLPIKLQAPLGRVLALGSELKATVALSKRNEVYVSQHLGDMKNDQTFASLTCCSEHLEALLSIQPEAIACDAHPGFRTNAITRGHALPVVRVQHHHAHMASCMAENGLDGPTIGVIFDGGGYGLDGTIWGGEFFVGDFAAVRRVASLRPFYLLGGDRAIREPLRVAIDILVRTYGEDFAEQVDVAFLRELDPDEKRVFTAMAKSKLNAFETSSMGRLFDAVSALLGVRLRTEYEAQAAIELESLLERDLSEAEPFPFEIEERETKLEIDYRPLIRAIVEAREPVATSSRRFHSTVVAIVAEVCTRLRERHGINDVVLSGGVFLNEFLLVNSLRQLRRRDFVAHHHRQVPTNDGGISLGQVMVANRQLALTP